MKKSLMLLAFIICMVSVNATLTNVTTNTPVPLGEKLIITGDHNASNVLCKFLIVDANSNKTIERLSDEYTFNDGSFYSERTINEPPYYRTNDYNVLVICDNEQAGSFFTVTQRNSINNFFFGELFYFMKNGNMIVYLIVGITGLVLLAGLTWATFRKAFSG